MKTSVKILILTLCTLQLSAQLDNGTLYPSNITGRDVMTNENIDVESWLENDKSVIVNFFTSWCSQCWDFKQSNWLNELNEKYGPNGTDEIRIVSVEAEPLNTLDHLNMEISGVIPNRSQGNWTEDINYSIIDDASFNQDFAIELAPVIYIIRPSGEMIELNRNNAIYDMEFQLKALFPKNKDIIINSDLKDASFCGNHVVPSSNVTVLNMGGQTIENFTLDYFVGQSVIQSIEINEPIKPLESKLIETESQALNSDSEINIFVSKINDQSYPIDKFNLVNAEVIEPVLNTSVLKMKLTFDEFPEETQWILRTDVGEEIARGNYSANEVEPWGTVEHDIVIPESTTCVKLTLEDSYGDGWLRWGQLADGSNTPIPGVQLYNEYGFLIKDKHNVESTTNFSTDLESIEINFFRDALSSENEVNLDSDLRIYPNPVDDYITIESLNAFESNGKITISNSLGKSVLTTKMIRNNQKIDVSNLQSGLYNIIIESNSQNVTKTIIKL